MSAPREAPPAAWDSRPRAAEPAAWRFVASRLGTLCLLELRRLSYDRAELYTRMVQPVLWLLVFGVTMDGIGAIPTGDVPYLDFLAPGILAQSALFISIFFGIQIIWERDSGVLAKLMVTPTPRSVLIAGKAFAAGVRALAQVVAMLVIAALIGVGLSTNPLDHLAAALFVVLGAGFFACLSMTIAGLVRRRDQLMGIGQAIMMPLFFASNALYPVELMPPWLEVVHHLNPMSYEVDALRGLLIGTPSHLLLDAAVTVGSLILGIAAASSLLPRLAR
jgi:ABC-2 type transport system permease protein